MSYYLEPKRLLNQAKPPNIENYRSDHQGFVAVADTKRGPTACPLAAPHRLSRKSIELKPTFKKAAILLDAQRRRLHGRVGRWSRLA
jgi:hypothetical protein